MTLNMFAIILQIILLAKDPKLIGLKSEKAFALFTFGMRVNEVAVIFLSR